MDADNSLIYLRRFDLPAYRQAGYAKICVKDILFFLSVEKLILNSYAKVNLYLEVFNKRKDNYHNIRTIFERIDLSDRIIIEPRQDKKIKIKCKSVNLPRGNSNLCYRAAKLLQDSLNIDCGLNIEIIKRIPVGAGLGGGSGNAAAVLLGLNKICKPRLSQNRLVALAKNIGSDVPFFVYNIPFAQGSSRGDRIRPLEPLRNFKLWHILVVPNIRVSTPFIYRRWDAYSRLTRLGRPNIPGGRTRLLTALTRPKYNAKISTPALVKNDASVLGRVLFNNLEIVTAKLYPEVRRIRERLSGLGLKSISMSGSGPAMFGIVSSRKEAVSLSRKLKRENRSWQVYVTRTL